MSRHIMDENSDSESYNQLATRLSIKKVGKNFLVKGVSDEQILAALHRLRATFHSQDKHFANPDWRHPRYCLIYYNVPRAKLADYVLRLLRPPFFRTHAKRLGKVIHVTPEQIKVWTYHGEEPQIYAW
ncbi:MAG: hypothetical protein ACE5PV_14020 [Candidatus Poribacteria bacterium]